MIVLTPDKFYTDLHALIKQQQNYHDNRTEGLLKAFANGLFTDVLNTYIPKKNKKVSLGKRNYGTPDEYELFLTFTYDKEHGEKDVKYIQLAIENHQKHTVGYIFSLKYCIIYHEDETFISLNGLEDLPVNDAFYVDEYMHILTLLNGHLHEVVSKKKSVSK